MKKFIQTTHTLTAPIQSIWSILERGDQVEMWLPIIKSSKLEGMHQRTCEMHEGGLLEETILKSEGNKTFMYAIDQQSAFPASDIVGMIRLEANGEASTQLYWDVEMEVETEEAFAQLKPMIEQVYAASAQKLSEVAQ